MDERRRTALLLIILFLVAGITGAVAVMLLYNATVKWQREILLNVVESQVQLVLGNIKVERAKSTQLSDMQLFDHMNNELKTSCSQLPVFGASGEVLIGQQQAGYIHFLASSHWQGESDIATFKASPQLAAPMHNALDGRHGTQIASDYRGVSVLAAYAPVPGEGLGIVAKMDLAEIRKPFAIAAFIVTVTALLCVLVMALLYARTTNPLSRKITASELRYRTLAESTDAISWEFDPLLDRWIYIAPQVERLLGYRTEEWTNHQWWIDHLHPDDQCWVPEFFAEHARKGESFNFEYRFVRKTGEVVWIRQFVGLEMDQEGPSMLRGYLFDITDRRAAEAELGKLNEQLNSTNEELTATNEELSSSNAELTAANEEIAAMNEELSAINEQLKATSEELESTCNELEQSNIDLKESQKQYYTLFHEMLEGCALHEIICDASGNPTDYRFLAINPAFERMTGLKESEIIGKTVLSVIPTIERHWIETYGKVALTGEAALFENYAEALQKHFEVTAYRPAPGQFACIFTDITQRKHVEETQRKTLEMLDDVLRHTQIMMIYLDADFNFIWVNRAYAEICQQEPSFFPGKNHFNLYPNEEYQTIFQQVVDTGEPYYASAIPLKFGTQPQRGFTYWDLSLIAVKDSSGSITGLVFSMAEATSRIKADAALRESERKLIEAQNLAQLGYWNWDIATGRVEWSDQVYKIFRLDRDSFTPQIDSILSFSPWPQDHERDQELIRRATESHENGEYIQRFLRLDNSLGYYHSTFHGVYDEAGNLLEINGTIQDITDRKIVEEELKTSEQKYRELFENAPAGIFRTSAKGEVLTINSAMARMLGLESTQATIQRFNHLEKNLYVYPEQRAEFIRQIQELGRVEGFEYQANTADGKIVWLSMNARISNYLEDDNFIIEGFVMDITERKRAEDALQESEAKYRQLIELASEGVWADDKDSITTFINPQMAKMLGYKPEEIVGRLNTEFMFAEDLITGDDGTLVQKTEIGDARRRGEKSTYEQRFRRADGKEVWCMVSGTPILGDDGEYLGSFGMLTDITERKYAEQTLASSELSYRRLFESAKDGILILDAETGIVDDVNPYLMEILNSSIDEFRGKTIWELGYFSDIVGSREQFSKLQQHEYMRHDELALHAADGHRIEVEFVSNVYRVNHRRVIQCNIRDISERKQVEMERTALEEQLRQVYKMEAIGTLAGGIAHDFNNLLFAILGNAELALDEIDPTSQAYANVQALVVAGNRAKGLVQQILAFSRKTRQEMVPLEMPQIVNEVYRMLRATLPSTLEIEQLIEPVTAFVIADPTEMHQVLMNLCTNAAIAMDQGPGVLGITLRETELGPDSSQTVLGLPPGLYIELGVSDTGHGISPEIQSRIFEPFFTTRETGKGTGLGLSVVHGIVTKMGGTIAVESKSGEGTRFKVYLPAQRGAAGTARPGDSLLPKGNAHILIVDDECNVLEVEQQILISLGYRVTCCASAAEALELLKRDPRSIDALLTDQTMPIQTGIELARDMFALCPGLPVILCTGYSEAVTPETVAAFNIKECLYKPVLKRELAEALQRVLQKSRTAEA